MASELIEEITDGSEPVVVLKAVRQSDGTVDLVVMRPDVAAENARLRAAITAARDEMASPGGASEDDLVRLLSAALDRATQCLK